MKQYTRALLFISLFLLPSLHASESVDYYSGGRLKDSFSIDDFKTDYILKLFRERKQLYVHYDLGKALEDLSFHMKAKFPDVEKVQLGDLAAKSGGKIPRHNSHQNGLDGDVVYFRTNKKTQSSTATEWEESFVSSSKITKNFDVARNWEALKYLVNNHPVQRIFVDAAVKKSMCSYASSIGEKRSEREVLRALRIENTVHKTHFHVRLKCPKLSFGCITQEAPPSGDGC
jgi:murein endopeptidase